MLVNGKRLALASVFIATLNSGCGNNSSPVAPTPVATPAPAPVSETVFQSTFSDLLPTEVALGQFTTDKTGTIDATVDWTFAADGIDVFISSGLCTAEQFNSGSCPFLAVSTTQGAKPKKLSISGASPGSYTIYVGNLGPNKESGVVTVKLTTQASASTRAESLSKDSMGFHVRDFVPLH
jgi:hypothetical protein